MEVENDIPSEASDLSSSQENGSIASDGSTKSSINGIQKDYFVKLLAKFIR